MQFRNARIDDIPDCVALLRRDGSCHLTDGIWAVMPALWEQLLVDGGLAALQIFESGDRLLAFRLSAFVNDRFATGFIKAPHPQVAALIWRLACAGASPLLDRQAVARANARGELNLVVLHGVARTRNASHPLMTRLFSMLPAAFQVAHAGYRIRRLLSYEVFDEHAARLMANIGFRAYPLAGPGPRVGDAARPGAVDEPSRSWVFHWDPLSSGFPTLPFLTAASGACPMPRFRLAPGQQRLLMAALEGRSDREIALSQGVRPDTVRQTWEAIYRRVDAVAPWLLASTDEGRHGRRGSEKRRNLIEYCRQHLEELRPWDWRELRPSGAGPDESDDGVFADTLSLTVDTMEPAAASGPDAKRSARDPRPHDRKSPGGAARTTVFEDTRL